MDRLQRKEGACMKKREEGWMVDMRGWMIEEGEGGGLVYGWMWAQGRRIIDERLGRWMN